MGGGFAVVNLQYHTLPFCSSDPTSIHLFTHSFILSTTIEILLMLVTTPDIVKN